MENDNKHLVLGVNNFILLYLFMHLCASAFFLRHGQDGDMVGGAGHGISL